MKSFMLAVTSSSGAEVRQKRQVLHRCYVPSPLTHLSLRSVCMCCEHVPVGVIVPLLLIVSVHF